MTKEIPGVQSRLERKKRGPQGNGGHYFRNWDPPEGREREARGEEESREDLRSAAINVPARM